MTKYFGLEIFDLEKYLRRREESNSDKESVLFTQNVELDGILNVSKFASRFFGKSQSWFSQRLNNCLVCRYKQHFKESDYATIAEAFRELSQQLSQYADELDKAPYIEPKKKGE